MGAEPSQEDTLERESGVLPEHWQRPECSEKTQVTSDNSHSAYVKLSNTFRLKFGTGQYTEMLSHEFNYLSRPLL